LWFAQPPQQLVHTAIQRPLRQKLLENGAPSQIGIAVECDVDPITVRLFELVERGSLLVPVAAAHGLQVRDLQAAAGGAGQVTLFVDSRQ